VHVLDPGRVVVRWLTFVVASLSQAGLRPEEVDAVAVTVGPGLEICLRVGATAARALAKAHDKPFVEVRKPTRSRS
jgi:tRNA A37 threonylcarbamoyltransferase TsaD